MEKSARLYKQVAGNSSEEDTYTPSNGSTVTIVELGGSAVFSNNVKVEIVWGTAEDEEIIFSTHGEVVHKCYELANLEGDGSKYLKIRLVNDTANTETIGGFYHAHIY